MKIAALVVGLIGALLTLGLGAKWVKDYEENKRLVASLQQMAGSVKSAEMDATLSEVSRTRTAGYLMIVFGIAAVGAAAVVFRKSKIAGGIMIVAAVAPALLAPKSLVFTFFLIVAGILALLAKPKPAAV